jgi:putative phage-type endonuclease
MHFREKRRKGIGGSDIAALFGLSKWGSPLSVYLEKLGESGDDDLDENEFIFWGNALEPVIADRFAKETGKELRVLEETIVSKNHNFMLAHIDRDVVGESAGLEVKTASQYKLGEWEGSVPTPYMLQCQHYMYVTEATHWYLAVLIGGNTFKHFVVKRDDELIEMIIDKCDKFWNGNVLKRVPPEATQLDSDLLSNLYSFSSADSVANLDSLSSEIARLDETNGIIRELESKRKLIENRIKSEMGESELGYSGDYELSWKPRTTNRIDVQRLKKEAPDVYSGFLKESQTRFFSIKKSSSQSVNSV